ncbi:MAG TPA: nucleoside hydrolase [Candidatus Limnocylindrales bacterium]|nr:nucleoside hydrolase [Candidatus Limnocylindrales bacterium]
MDRTGSPMPLILDVDTGIDDSLALLLAAATPEVELVAVTTVAGNVPLARVDENTRAVLELAGARSVPVARGPDRPLVKDLRTAEDTHGPCGIGYAELAPAMQPAVKETAAEVIVRAARSRPGEVTLLTLGPLTNLALALDREPALPGLLRGWTLMGGAYCVPGNTTPTAEWNVFVDPEAAAACFRAWAEAEPVAADAADGVRRPLAIGLDVTERARILPEHLRHLALRAGARPQDAEALAREPLTAVGSVGDDPILRFVVDALRFYFEFHAAADGFYGAFVHDPFALAATLDRGLVQARPVFVEVETGGGPAHAMTVADWRGLTRRPPNVDVAVDGDADAFRRLLVERLGGLAADRSGVAR